MKDLVAKFEQQTKDEKLDAVLYGYMLHLLLDDIDGLKVIIGKSNIDYDLLLKDPIAFAQIHQLYNMLFDEEGNIIPIDSEELGQGYGVFTELMIFVNYVAYLGDYDLLDEYDFQYIPKWVVSPMIKGVVGIVNTFKDGNIFMKFSVFSSLVLPFTIILYSGFVAVTEYKTLKSLIKTVNDFYTSYAPSYVIARIAAMQNPLFKVNVNELFLITEWLASIITRINNVNSQISTISSNRYDDNRPGWYYTKKYLQMKSTSRLEKVKNSMYFVADDFNKTSLKVRESQRELRRSLFDSGKGDY